MAKRLVVDPRQALFLSFYLDPKSETFSNALQSALRAGYAQQYAESLLAQLPDWLSEKLGEHQMLNKAERNLENILDVKTYLPKIGMFGPIKDPETKRVVYEEDTGLLKIKADISKFVAERLGKRKYAQRNENVNVNIPVPIYGGLSVQEHNSNKKDIQAQETN